MTGHALPDHKARAKRLSRVLHGTKCLCGGEKKRNMIACDGCWSKLTSEEKGKLSNQLKCSFILTFEEAFTRLGHKLPEMPIVQAAQASSV